VDDSEITQSDAVSNEVNVQLDVFGAAVMNRILAHVDGGDVVAVGHRRAVNVAV
jgi:hypothetical protein